MNTTNNENINNYCEENIKFIYQNLPKEYKKKSSYKNIRSICKVYNYMELELLCITDIHKYNSDCLNYFKKLNILPLSLIEVEIENKYFPENEIYYNKLLNTLINIRPYIKYYYDIYTKYMKIEIVDIPPNSIIEFYNSKEPTFGNTSRLNMDKPKIIKIIKVCDKIVKYKYVVCPCEETNKNRRLSKEQFVNYLYDTFYKIY